MADLNLAVIGNCGYGALIDGNGRIVWACMPRFDGDPVFCALLAGDQADQAGFFDIELVDFAHSEQRYVSHTAIVVTTLHDKHGSAVEITDFAPRFRQYGRIFRPTTLVRRLHPLRGSPRIRVRLRPTHDYGARRPDITRGSNHIRYIMPGLVLRLSTNVPPSYVLEETPFVLEGTLDLILAPDESLTASISETGRGFLEQTRSYWRDWTRSLSIPFEWQEMVIRSAITLKLCSFEETGAIIAAITTSIPEAPSSGRNWDYRFCWLRDAYFVVHALNRLGATKTMENYLSYITNVAADSDGRLQPVFGITLESRLVERQVDSLAGYRAMGPVRVGNEAYLQVQNDSYGSAVLAVTHTFFDRRFVRPGNRQLFERLEKLGEIAVATYDKPDAGLWELRTRERVHTYSSVMCWAACDRMAKIAAHLELGERAAYWRDHADRMRAVILEHAWDPTQDSFVESFGGHDIDASLLLLHELGFVAPGDPRFLGTLAAVERRLKRGDHILRYSGADDFGRPESAFNVCTFWYIEALAAVGRKAEARALFTKMLEARTPLGLLSEDMDPETGELWGNFPQTYSMVGLINAAMRLSKSWEEAF